MACLQGGGSCPSLPPSRLSPDSSSWAHHFRILWTILQRKTSLASCQDPSSTSARDIPPWRPPLCPSSCRSVSQDTSESQTHPPSSLSSSRQRLPRPKAVLVTVQVSRSYPTSAGSQWLTPQLPNERLACLFRWGLANQYFDRSPR